MQKGQCLIDLAQRHIHGCEINSGVERQCVEVHGGQGVARGTGITGVARGTGITKLCVCHGQQDLHCGCVRADLETGLPEALVVVLPSQPAEQGQCASMISPV
jgi:hypothetical protein